MTIKHNIAENFVFGTQLAYIIRIRELINDFMMKAHNDELKFLRGNVRIAGAHIRS